MFLIVLELEIISVLLCNNVLNIWVVVIENI